MKQKKKSFSPTLVLQGNVLHDWQCDSSVKPTACQLLCRGALYRDIEFSKQKSPGGVIGSLPAVTLPFFER